MFIIDSSNDSYDHAEIYAGDGYSYNAGTHTFTVYGEGGMSDYDSPVTEFEEELDYRPWRSYCKEIEYLIIESGVTYLGRNAF